MERSPRKSKIEAMIKIQQCLAGKSPDTVTCAGCGKVWPKEKEVMRRGYHKYCQHTVYCWECLPCAQNACFTCRME